MSNAELIDSLNGQYLFSLVELLSRGLMMPEESLWRIADEELFYDLPFEPIARCEDLNDYERLKLMQQVVNTLVAEAEKPGISMLQLALPLTTANSTTLKPALLDY
jgi:hypothetical protein